jgi:WD40 repeat protein
LIFFNAELGAPVFQTESYKHPGVVFSPDERFVLIEDTLLVHLLDVMTWKEIRQWNTLGPSSSNVFSPDGKSILSISVSGETVDVMDLETGNSIKQIRCDAKLIDAARFSSDVKHIRIKSAGFSSDGRYLLIKSAGFSSDAKYLTSVLILWGVQTDKDFRAFQDDRGDIAGASIVSEGKYLLTCSFKKESSYSSKEGLWSLWDVQTAKKIREWEFKDEVVAFNDNYFVTRSPDKTLRLVDVETGKNVRQFEVGSQGISSAVFSPDGKFLMIGSYDKTVKLWETETGKELRQFNGYSNRVDSVEYSPDGKYILSDDKLNIFHERVWELDTGKSEIITKDDESVAYSPDGNFKVKAWAGAGGWPGLIDVKTGEVKRQFNSGAPVDRLEYSPDGKYILTQAQVGTPAGVRVWDASTGKLLRHIASAIIDSASFSPDSQFVLTRESGSAATLWSVNSDKTFKLHGNISPVYAASFSPDGKYVLTGGNPDSAAHLWEVKTGKDIQQFQGHLDIVRSVAYSLDGQRILTGSYDLSVKMWDAKTARELRQFDGHSGAVTGVGFSPDERFVLSGSEDGTTRIWEADTGKELCRLISFSDGSWAVVDSEGHFDTNNIEEIKGLHWIMPDDPMKPLPIEIFMRDYYEPRLLPRLLNGEKFKQTRNLSDLNRVQPQIRIAGIERQKDKPDLVTVTVEVAKARSERQRDKQNNLRETDVYDIRLFRNGQIVGQFPSEAHSQSGAATRLRIADAQELAVWRQSNQVKLDPTGKRTIKFENIRLPRQADIKHVEFSAYAFNEDRIKSQTDRKTFDIPPDLTPRKGRAYIISVGVNAYENPSFDLKYSVNDARAIQQTIFDRLSKNGDYSDIVQVPLISDSKQVGDNRELIENTATKQNFKAVLDLLAGRAVDPEVKKKIPNADKLQQAQPEDLVLISFSSHGYADSDGNFFFVLYDTGAGTKREVTDELLDRAVSSEELSVWLRDVDAGEMMMIVDACHSAAAIEGKEFKPGPMGSRGLGQLSYDKGMKILTATQADDVAIGAGSLRQGLLTYSLVKDGIESGKADFKPADKTIRASEWLEYGETRVPKLYDEIMKGEVASELKDLVHKRLEEIRRQRPSLFDFSRKRRDALIVRQ